MTDRLRAIRRSIEVLAPDVEAHYLRTLPRALEQDLTDGAARSTVQRYVEELDRLEMARRTQHLSEASAAYGRAMLVGILELIRDSATNAPTTTALARDALMNVSNPRYLSIPGLRLTQDWFYFHEEQWTQSFSHLGERAGIRALEIGAYEGRSTTWIAENLACGPESVLVTIDTFDYYEHHQQNFRHNLAQSPVAEQHTLTLKGPSQQLLPALPEESFDFVYVDGAHQRYPALQDAILTWPLVKPGGFIVYDDYGATAYSDAFGIAVREAVDTFLTTVPGRYDVVFDDFQLALRKR